MTERATMTSSAEQTIGLATRLREETTQAHSAAENSDFMSQLLKGSLNRQAAIDLTSQLYFVYAALEQAVRANAGAAQVDAVFDSRLEREGALAADLEYLIGANWLEHIEPVAATRNYVERLEAIEQEGDANLALAHHYVRYLGDLSGGQVIASMLSRHYGIGAEGTHFYNFDEIGKIKPYRDAYRARISALEMPESDKDAVVAEAKEAFRLNREIFQALS